MRHNRAEVIERVTREFKLLDRLVASLSDEDWQRLVPRPETKERWKVKDALAHIVYWKADVARQVRGQRRPPEIRGLSTTESNHVVYVQWRERTPQELLAWHRQVHKDIIAALKAAPDEWFSSKDRDPDWPGDLTSHSSWHRVRDIEQALEKPKPKKKTKA